jgi:hypothetical protein
VRWVTLLQGVVRVISYLRYIVYYVYVVVYCLCV